MEKWDSLAMILEDNNLKHLLEIIHKRTKWDVDMMETIADAAAIWKSQTREQNEIVETLLEYSQLAIIIKDKDKLSREIEILKQ